MKLLSTQLILIVLALFLGSCSRPTADFITQEESYTAPAEIEFVNKSKNADNWTWEFGDGNSSIEQSPDNRYISSGNYTIELKASKGKKSDIITKNIIVKAPEDCLIEISTPYGNMLVRLFDDTPLHRDNFLSLVEKKYYDEMLFHRVINGFMIQGGDPDSKNAPADAALGRGGPGYQVDAEISANRAHLKGALAAARMGDAVNPEKKSSGSQFYIVQGKAVDSNLLDAMERQKGIKYTSKQREKYMEVGGTPFLDGDYTVFGQVIEGMDVIDKIANSKTGLSDRPVSDITMKVISIK
jgi:peptidyl-prolyl cis-trans isomerase B (cyclophilin B)